MWKWIGSIDMGDGREVAMKMSRIVPAALDMALTVGWIHRTHLLRRAVISPAWWMGLHSVAEKEPNENW